MNPHRRPMLTLTTFKSTEISHTLFDFDNPLNQNNYIVNSNALVYRLKNNANAQQHNLQVVTQEDASNGDLPDFSSEMIFSISIRPDQHNFTYSLDEPTNKTDYRTVLAPALDKLPFLCLNNHGRRNEVKSSKIKEGDVIRLGKIYLKVVETHLSANNSSLSNSIQPLSYDRISQIEDPSVAKTCRICLMEDSEGLISPCQCKGSCQYVHLDCLKLWLQSKVTRQENRLVSAYLLSKFQCQLCKQQLPNKITSNRKSVQFVELRKPDEPYLILERLQQGSKDKILYVVTPKDCGVILGRGTQCDIRFNDLSISRMHSLIEYKNGQFCLSDLGSKFGTLLLLQQKQLFDKILCLQLDNKVYKLEVFPSLHPRTYTYL